MSTDETNADSKQQQQKRKNGTKRRNVLAKKIGAIISSAFGKRKAQEMCVYTSEESNVSGRGNKTRHQVALNRSCSFHAKGKRKGSRRNEATRRCPTVSLSLSVIFRKRCGFGFRKWRAIKIVNADANGNEGSGVERCSYGRITRAKLVLKRDDRCGEKTRVAEEDAGELELCKKRILMGEKCRPLNISGTLHYDKNGVLLPEDVLPSEEP
ncbi:hypothetical protein Salat_1531600 [Sesamum alatum]|uniref:Uncharacterized protein n=1 Tax=Sesamum alatum TaxID=300844 RepID=A0AAE2CMH0_9LAMI|nr:hypothetical protein Salat_1531600 [Sesamum alatum]